jgi:hypothetical protein
LHVTTVGNVRPQQVGRVYIFSDLGNIRPIFSQICQSISDVLLPDARCTFVTLVNKTQQYFTTNFTPQSLWLTLTNIRNDQTSRMLSWIHLTEDISINRGYQCFIICTSDDQFDVKQLEAVAEDSQSGISILAVEAAKRLEQDARN